MSLTISFAELGLLAEQEKFQELEPLLTTALTDKLPVVLDLSNKVVCVGTDGPRANADTVVLRGQRISPEINLANLTTRLGLCLPFIVHVQQIVIPPGSFSTFGRPHRPLADLFMRNFLNAALTRRVKFEFASANSSDLTRDLQRSYSWMLKTLVQDDVLHDPDIAERLLRACHFEVDLGNSSFFARVACEVRSHHMKQHSPLCEGPNMARLVSLRSQIMLEFQ